MITKSLEIRDSGTFIPVVAILTCPTDEAEEYLLNRAGFKGSEDMVILVKMNCAGIDRNASYDQHAWGGRTFPVAHNYIKQHFHELASGDVIDVEFILGETSEKKKNERLERHIFRDFGPQ